MIKNKEEKNDVVDLSINQIKSLKSWKELLRKVSESNGFDYFDNENDKWMKNVTLVDIQCRFIPIEFSKRKHPEAEVRFGFDGLAFVNFMENPFYLFRSCGLCEYIMEQSPIFRFNPKAYGKPRILKMSWQKGVELLNLQGEFLKSYYKDH